MTKRLKGPRDPEIVKKIAERNKNNPNLKEAMKRVHARRLASGEDKKIRDKIRKTRIARGDWIDGEKSDYENYVKSIRKLTERQPINTLENFHLRGPGQYHLDHIVSKKTGFELGLPPEFISDICNLRFITERENCSKQGRNTIDETTNLWFHLSTELEY